MIDTESFGQTSSVQLKALLCVSVSVYTDFAILVRTIRYNLSSWLLKEFI